MSANPPPDASTPATEMTAAPSGPVRFEPGARPVAGYELEGLIARGGFGDVWRATGPGGFRFALKFVRLAGRPAEKELRGLDLMKHIGHAHLLRLFGAWEHDGFLIVAMELADGTLEQRLEEAVASGLSGIPPTELLRYMDDAAEGLDFLNFEKGIQHRDVKPKNLLLKGGSLLVADFGLAKLLEHTATSHTGSMTLAYAAPEFFEGESTRWSDQYALAITYCQLRGNKLPFQGNPAQLTTGHLTKAPDLSMLPTAEAEVVARALAKPPRQRWPSCRAFVQALLTAAPSPAEADTVLAIAPAERREVVNTLGMKFVWIPPGSFERGSPEGEPGRDPSEQRHRVLLSRGFFLAVHPVTQTQWRAVMGTNPSHFVGDDRPVEQVSWLDCQEFCAKLGAATEGQYRLPTEAEWEYACRAGTTTAYHGGDGEVALQGVGWYGGNSGGTTHPVGTRTANAWGLGDLHGNVWEWAADWYGPYPTGDVRDPKGPQKGRDRVLRGGSWGLDAAFCRSAARARGAPTRRDRHIGCRVVLM